MCMLRDDIWEVSGLGQIAKGTLSQSELGFISKAIKSYLRGRRMTIAWLPTSLFVVWGRNLVSNWLHSSLMLPLSPWGFLTPSSPNHPANHITFHHTTNLGLCCIHLPPFPQNIPPVHILDKFLFTSGALFQRPLSLESFPYSCCLQDQWFPQHLVNTCVIALSARTVISQHGFLPY